MRRRLTCGWCQSDNHRRCPRIMRAHRVTPLGKELREIVCACTCPSENKPVSYPEWEDQLLPGYEV